MVKEFLKWMYREKERIWQRCRKGGQFYSLTRKQARNLPSPFKEKYEKKGYLGPMNKVGILSSRKTAFLIGFSEGWGLAITTEEGYK